VFEIQGWQQGRQDYSRSFRLMRLFAVIGLLI